MPPDMSVLCSPRPGILQDIYWHQEYLSLFSSQQGQRRQIVCYTRPSFYLYHVNKVEMKHKVCTSGRHDMYNQ